MTKIISSSSKPLISQRQSASKKVYSEYELLEPIKDVAIFIPLSKWAELKRKLRDHHNSDLIISIGALFLGVALPAPIIYFTTTIPERYEVAIAIYMLIFFLLGIILIAYGWVKKFEEKITRDSIINEMEQIENQFIKDPDPNSV